MVEFVTIVYLFYIFTTLYMTTLILMIHIKNRKNYFRNEDRSYTPTLTVLVPMFNEGDTIKEALGAILAAEYPEDKLKVLVVDDCSKDNSYGLVEEYAKDKPQITLLQTPENTGNAAGSKNYGLKFVDTDIVAVVDADSYVDKEAFIRMAYLFADEKIGAVTGSCFVKNRDNILGKCQGLEYVAIAWTRRLMDFVDSVFVTPGSLSMYRKKALDDISGFDYGILTEDIEIAWNLMRNGWGTRMNPDSYVFTTVPTKFKPWWRQRIRWNLGGFQTLWKHKHLIFKKGHVMLGQFVIPFFLGHLFISFSGFFVFSYIILKKLYEWLLFTFFSVSVDSAVLKASDIYFLPSVFTYFAILVFLSFFISTLIAFKTLKRSGIKLRFHFIIYTLFYLAVFPILLIASLYPLLRKNYKW